MKYFLEQSDEIKKKFKKLARKDRKQIRNIHNKVEEIRENPEHYKPLRNELKGIWRVQIGSFVLLYTINEKEKIMKLLDYDHHDKIY